MKTSLVFLVYIVMAIPLLAHGQAICPVDKGKAPVRKIVGQKGNPVPCVEATAAPEVVESSVKPFVVSPKDAPDAWLPRIAFAIKGNVPKDGLVFVRMFVGKNGVVRHDFETAKPHANGISWYRFADAGEAASAFKDAPASVRYEIGIRDTEFEMDDVLYGGDFKVINARKLEAGGRFEAVLH